VRTTILGLIAGLLLAIAILLGDWGGFLLALVLGIGGALLVGQLSGEIDVRAMTRGRQRA
jgi:uncharacterized membrane protein YeaQ/YmgE (transglycosylase-associated protein family)